MGHLSQPPRVPFRSPASWTARHRLQTTNAIGRIVWRCWLNERGVAEEVEVVEAGMRCEAPLLRRPGPDRTAITASCSTAYLRHLRDGRGTPGTLADAATTKGIHPEATRGVEW